MLLRELRELVRAAPPLGPGDSVAKCVRLMRARGLPALPVAHEGRLIGWVREEQVARGLEGAADPAAFARATRVEHVMEPLPGVVGEYAELGAAVRVMGEQAVGALPVVAADGRYLGMLLRREALAALAGELLAPALAGLATPFGVYLTTGAARAGANDLALAATGATLMVINLIAMAVVSGVARLLQEALPGPVGAAIPGGAGAVGGAVVAYGLQVALFLVLLRLSALTGVHAAEHMVVHAIEEGEDLALEKVRAMPRVHPRCGTNLMALLILLMIFVPFLFSLGDRVGGDVLMAAVVVLVVVVLASWRRLGAGLQRWVTTRRPSERQLLGAIAVGEALLAKVRSAPWARGSSLRRMWNAGFLQVMGGFVATALAAEYGGPALATAWSALMH